jgi:TetR/AcrR family transcriptional repressor of nem operon
MEATPLTARQDIIIAAAKLIESKGYHNTNISEILEASHTGKGQFYYYFQSKHALGMEVLDFLFAAFKKNMIEGILDSRLEPEGKIDAMLAWIVAFHRERDAQCGCAFGNLALEMSEHDEAFREKVEEVFALWTGRLADVISGLPGATGGHQNAQGLAQAVVAMIEGGILLMKNKKDITVLAGVCGRVKTLIHATLQA